MAVVRIPAHFCNECEYGIKKWWETKRLSEPREHIGAIIHIGSGHVSQEQELLPGGPTLEMQLSDLSRPLKHVAQLNSQVVELIISNEVRHPAKSESHGKDRPQSSGMTSCLPCGVPMRKHSSYPSGGGSVAWKVVREKGLCARMFDRPQTGTLDQ